MKKLITLVALVGLVALPVSAQYGGMPLADTAAAPKAGLMRASAGIIVGDDFNEYGARFTYGAIDPLAVFVDLGILDPDGGDSAFAIQGGATYTLPIEAPVDLAARLAISRAAYSESTMGVDVDLTLLSINAGVLASKMVAEPISVYGYLGLNWEKADIDAKSASIGGFQVDLSDSDSETDIAIGIGAIYALDQNLSFYGELDYIDDAFLGLGARWQF